MSRRTKTLLPSTETLLRLQVSDTEEQQRLLRQQQLKRAQFYNKTAKDLPKLAIGDFVRMKPIKNHQRIWRKATVTQKVDDRSYVVETPEGGIYRRNRYHLRKTKEAASPKPVEAVVVAPADKPVDPPEQPEPAVSLTPPTVPAHTEVSSRPTRNRRPPSYLKDYVCD